MDAAPVKVAELLGNITSCHKEPILLPEYILYDNLRLIICAVLIIGILHILFYSIISQRLSGLEAKEKKQEVMKTSYQATNFCINLFFGIYGMYHLLTQDQRSYTSVIHRLLLPSAVTSMPVHLQFSGSTQFTTFGSLQIAYNLWALPVGLFLVDESPLILTHHFCVIFTGFVVSSFSHGFRYHTPMLFGVMEFSSLPLAFMNYFRDHPEWTKKNYGKESKIVRVVFAISFLWIRCWLASAHHYHLIRNSGLLFYTSVMYIDAGSSSISVNAYRLVMGLFCSGSLLLTSLQYYWGYLIVKGLWKMVSKKEKRKKE